MSKRIWDLVERVGLTFIGAFIAVYIYTIAGGQSALEAVSDKELLDKAITAGIAALVPLVTGLVGFKIGDKDTASIVTVKPKQDNAEKVMDADVPQESPAPLVKGEQGS